MPLPSILLPSCDHVFPDLTKHVPGTDGILSSEYRYLGISTPSCGYFTSGEGSSPDHKSDEEQSGAEINAIPTTEEAPFAQVLFSLGSLDPLGTSANQPSHGQHQYLKTVQISYANDGANESTGSDLEKLDWAPLDWDEALQSTQNDQQEVELSESSQQMDSVPC
jgi:hypothetical protein